MIALILFLGYCSTSCSTDTDLKSTSELITEDEALPIPFKSVDCPDGYVPVWEEEFVTLRLHRPSSHCNTGFSFCSVYKWVKKCYPAENVPPKPKAPNTLAEVSVVAQLLPGNQILLRFPIELLTEPGFTASDFATFGLESDYDNGTVIMKAGDYVPTYTATEIRVVVDIY